MAEGLQGHVRSEARPQIEKKCRRRRCVRERNRETEAEIMNVKVGETESTASVKTQGRTRRPQTVGPESSAQMLPVIFVPLSLKSSPVSLLKAVTSQVKEKNK